MVTVTLNCSHIMSSLGGSERTFYNAAAREAEPYNLNNVSKPGALIPEAILRANLLFGGSWVAIRGIHKFPTMDFNYTCTTYNPA